MMLVLVLLVALVLGGTEVTPDPGKAHRPPMGGIELPSSQGGR